MARRKQHQENPDDSVIVQLHPEVEEPPEPEVADDQVAEPLASDEQAEPAPDEQPERPRWRGHDLNRVDLIGRLTADPEGRVMDDGLHITWFRMATNGRSSTEFHQLVAFEKTAKFVAEYLEKGRHVFVEGRLQTRSYTDRNGIDRKQTVIVAHRVLPLDHRRPDER